MKGPKIIDLGLDCGAASALFDPRHHGVPHRGIRHRKKNAAVDSRGRAQVVVLDLQMEFGFATLHLDEFHPDKLIVIDLAHNQGAWRISSCGAGDGDGAHPAPAAGTRTASSPAFEALSTPLKREIFLDSVGPIVDVGDGAREAAGVKGCRDRRASEAGGIHPRPSRTLPNKLIQLVGLIEQLVLDRPLRAVRLHEAPLILDRGVFPFEGSILVETLPSSWVR